MFTCINSVTFHHSLFDMTLAVPQLNVKGALKVEVITAFSATYVEGRLGSVAIHASRSKRKFFFEIFPTAQFTFRFQ